MGLFSAYAAKKKWMNRFKRLATHLYRVSGDEIISLTDALALKTFLFVGTITDTKETGFSFLQNDQKMEKESIAFLAFMVENYIEYYWDEEASDTQKDQIVRNYYKKICYLAEKEYGMDSSFAEQIFKNRVEHYKETSKSFPMNKKFFWPAAKEFYNITEFTKSKRAMCLLDMSLNTAPFIPEPVESTLAFFIYTFEPSIEEEIAAISNFDVIGVGLRETSDVLKYLYL